MTIAHAMGTSAERYAPISDHMGMEFQIFPAFAGEMDAGGHGRKLILTERFLAVRGYNVYLWA